jgi:nanoRNase/pAp phosphatase (c-di-AMP/oligoRNAs hydrolase)/soluble P-type ATPase
MYLLLGCGIVGFAVATGIHDRGGDLAIIERDPKRVKDLSEKGFYVIEGDYLSSSSLVKKTISEADVIIIATASSEDNKRIIAHVRSINPYAIILARGYSVADVDAMNAAGAGVVVIPQVAVAESLLHHLSRGERVERTRRLSRGFKKGERIGIIVHDNPDPDAIASAMALRLIAGHHGMSADILFGGEVGHQQNKVFVNLIGVNLVHIDEYNKYLIRGYDRLALIDLSSDANTSILPSDVMPDIILDHHPKTADYSPLVEDIRPSVGSVSSMMVQYLIDYGYEVDSKHATALLYGIMTDTNNFRRRISREDVEAVAWLQGKTDQDMLMKIENPTISPDVLEVIGKAVLGRDIVSGYVLSNVGYIAYRDSLPQAADFLLNLEGVTTVVVFGVLNDALYVSARTRDIKINLGQTLEKAFGSIGSAGGHLSAAGARIPLGIFGMIDDKEILKNLAGEAVKKMFLKAVGIYSTEG